MDREEREEQARLMGEQRDQGWTHKQIAAEHGVSVATVAKRIGPTSKRDRTPDRGPHPSKAADTAAMWAEWVKGATQQEIANRYGLHQTTVSERLKRYQETLPEDTRETILRREIDRLDQIFTPLLTLATSEPPPAYSNGRPMVDDDGKAVPDWSVVISASQAVLKIQDRLAKFLGLDAPAKAEVLHVEAASEAARAAAGAAAARLAAAGE